jgi:hypothetical protein
LAGRRGLDQPYELALAQAGALVRATIEQGEELALHVEDRDLPALDLDPLPRARRDLGHRGDDVPRH